MLDLRPFPQPITRAEFRGMTSGSARRLTGVAGRWSATHPWTAIAAWVGCVLVLLVTGHLGLAAPSSAETTIRITAA